MQSRHTLLGAAAIVTMLATPAYAEILRSNVAFNNSIGEQTADQPAGGVEVAYKVTLEGGDLDGCAVEIVEALHPRDDGAWGIFDIKGDVVCDGGGFSYTSSGAWDANGFHASGEIESGSGSGDYEGISGRVAQLGGAIAAAGDNTLDVSYELVFDTAET